MQAFVPAPLPPDPPIDWPPDLRDKFDHALMALGRLDSAPTLLPDTMLFLYMYVRKEAVLSSMIEGTQSSISDLLLFELDQVPGVPLDDVREVSNYIAALKHGLSRMAGGFPISLRLIKEMHGILLARGRGSHQSPGDFRRSQNWIGGTRPGNATFVPLPPEKVLVCMGEFEHFLHDRPEHTPALLKAALAHVQFETIHPFLDGNGRLGRLLITLLLCEQKALQEPMLYLSLYFKTHRQYYYKLLNEVRLSGNMVSGGDPISSFQRYVDGHFFKIRGFRFIAVVKGRRPGHLNLSVSKVPHCMRDNRGELVLSEAGGNPVGDTTFQICD